MVSGFKTCLALASLLCAGFAHAADKPFIISGFDDVLRQADNTGLLQAGAMMLTPDRTFTGMPELYDTITSDENAPKFALVSATSTWFGKRFNKFLDGEAFPSRTLYLRNWVTQRSIDHFKISQIEGILKGIGDQKAIVIFDNSEPSLEMAVTINEKFPDQIKAVYLHQIIQKTLPASAHLYYNAFDIALSEYEAGRAELSDVTNVAKVILNETKKENLFPAYAICPADYDPCGQITDAAAGVCSQVKEHVQELCEDAR
jgi:hypothetical protein